MTLKRKKRHQLSIVYRKAYKMCSSQRLLRIHLHFSIKIFFGFSRSISAQRYGTRRHTYNAFILQHCHFEDFYRKWQMHLCQWPERQHNAFIYSFINSRNQMLPFCSITRLNYIFNLHLCIDISFWRMAQSFLLQLRFLREIVTQS